MILTSHIPQVKTYPSQKTIVPGIDTFTGSSFGMGAEKLCFSKWWQSLSIGWANASHISVAALFHNKSAAATTDYSQVPILIFKFVTSSTLRQMRSTRLMVLHLKTSCMWLYKPRLDSMDYATHDSEHDILACIAWNSFLSVPQLQSVSACWISRCK